MSAAFDDDYPDGFPDGEFGRDEPARPPQPPSPLEACAGPDDAAAWARTVPPGADTFTVLAVLDPARMSDAGRIDLIAAAEAGLAWLSAIQDAALASLNRQPGNPPGPHGTGLDKAWETLEVSCVLGVSGQRATDQLDRARELHGGRLSDTGTAMRQGRISPWRARVLSDEVTHCDNDAAAAVQAEILPHAASLTFGQYTRRIRKAILTHAAPVHAEQRERAVADRKVTVGQPDQLGMNGLYAFMSAEAVAAVHAALDTLARRYAPNDPRTLDQRRADALLDLATTTLHGIPCTCTCTCTGGGTPPAAGTPAPDGTPAPGSPPNPGSPPAPGGTSAPGGAPGGLKPGGLKPAINITVALSTLLGYDDQAAELNGHPIPATLARTLATDPTGTWRRLLTDQRGVLLDYGRKTYRPPANLARFIAARDRECVFPTCSRKADTCEIDHELPWAKGGGTTAPNLATVSPRHHHARHEGGWQNKRQPDGSTQWTSPTGHTYVKPPATYPIDHTARSDDPPQNEDPPPF